MTEQPCNLLEVSEALYKIQSMSKDLGVINEYQAKYYAHELIRSYSNDHVGKLAGLLFDAQVEPKPHQIDAALFALQTPFLPGVILADEVGLGKTIEAGIVITQYWAERKRKILIIAPSSLRQQWQQELREKFLIPSTLLEAKLKDEQLTQSIRQNAEVLICSYEFALRHETSLIREWDLVICDEAHRLRNIYTGRNKGPEAVSRIVRGAHKTLLLTATPLQNRLEELYGLVSVFDPGYFYSLDAFRERYIKSRTSSTNDDLVERVAALSKRTLRRDAEKYIHFTKRLPITIEFQPSKAEIELYNKVNAYLQRDELFAFSNSQRHLTALVIRKRLGSSTYAVASTLENIAIRLNSELEAGIRRDNRGFVIMNDFSPEDLTEEEWEELDGSRDKEESGGFGPEVGEKLNSETLQAMRREVEELKSYAELARSIRVNEKASKLNEALTKGFDRLKDLGASEKAIIFTDSTKTQEYIARSLIDAGWGEGLILFNGSNDSPLSNEIYKEWLLANKGGDVITGIPAADRRKALVDYFRNSGKIMIATEAAAEGINLQFCSMVVNYDLPWNPQRVEQRIGRAHRFGQKYDVVVVNFSNKGNIAEARILELLADKFHLFESVFGASDEVLGAIEDGFDFEKKINEILSNSRSDSDIDSAFQELETLYAIEINSEMAAAKSRVFDNLDPNVQDRLKTYDSQSSVVLNKFERLLLEVTKRELRTCATFDLDGSNFHLDKSPIEELLPGKYYFKSTPIENAHQFRFDSPLAEWVIRQALETQTPTAQVTFSISNSQRVSTSIKSLVGKSGELVVKKITFSMKAKNEIVKESYMLAGAFSDEGAWFDDEYVSEILALKAVKTQSSDHVIETKFEMNFEERIKELQVEVQGRNSKYYDQQEELLYRNLQDRHAESEGRIREYRNREKEARKNSKLTDDPLEQLKFKQEARRWADKAEDEDEDARSVRKSMRQQAEEYLSLIAESLKGSKSVEHLFAIRWNIVE